MITIRIPELDQFPPERRESIFEDFNKSPKTAALQERLDKLPFQLAGVLMLAIIGIMVWFYHMGLWPCMLAAFLCLVVGVPLGIVLQLVLWRRAFKKYVQANFTAGP